MKSRIIFAAMAALACSSGPAFADCFTRQLDLAEMNTTLVGKTVCGRPGPGYPSGSGRSADDRWQEQHRGSGSSGELWDYKKGSDRMDPTKRVGTWSISNSEGPAQVTYDYGGSEKHSYRLFDNDDGTYSFCKQVAEYVVATVKPGHVSCAGEPGFP